MALHRIDVPPRDVDPGALGLLLVAAGTAERPPAPPLAELVLREGSAALALGVLGASHAVTATDGTSRVREEVSCDAVAAGGRPLPRRARAAGYAMTSASTAVPAAVLAAAAERLLERAAADPSWLCGAFPGDAAALTALTGAARPGGGWTWRTWHCYPGPEEGVLVRTRSTWTP